MFDERRGRDILLQADVELGAVVRGMHGSPQLPRELEQVCRVQRRRAIAARNKYRVTARERLHQQVCAGFAGGINEGIQGEVQGQLDI